MEFIAKKNPGFYSRIQMRKVRTKQAERPVSNKTIIIPLANFDFDL